MGFYSMPDDVNGEKTGVAAAISQIDPRVVRVPGSEAPEQLALLPLCPVGEDQRARTGISPAGGRGRPPGATNRSTEEFKKFILSQYSHPLQGLAEMYSRPVAQLAKEMGLSYPTFDQLYRLLQLQKDCMKELAPYVASKMPQAVNIDGPGLMTLQIFGSENNGAKTSDQPVTMLNSESEQNQGLSADDFEKSNDGESNETTENEGERGYEN